MSTPGEAESVRGGPISPVPVVLSPGERIEPLLRPPPPDANWIVLGCSCGCLERGKPCRNGRRIRAEQRADDVRRGLLSVLTDEDKAWLAEHGWRP